MFYLEQSVKKKNKELFYGLGRGDSLNKSQVNGHRGSFSFSYNFNIQANTLMLIKMLLFTHLAHAGTGAYLQRYLKKLQF